MNFDNLINDYFSKIYSGNINEFNKFVNNNNLSINITNKNKENALHVVIKSDLSDILKINFIKYLISKNININDKDCFGNTPFNLACQKQLYNIMIVLYNKFKDRKIDFLSVDVEGSELAILKNFDFAKYSPKVIVVEYLDLSLKNLDSYRLVFL